MSNFRIWTVEMFYAHVEPWLIAVFGVLVTCCGYLVKKVWESDNRLAAQEAIAASVRESLERLEAGHIRIEQKVDNLIERSHQDMVAALRAELDTRHVKS